MEPASAIGIASAAICFVEFTYKFTSTLFSLVTEGTATDHDSLEDTCRKMRDMSRDILLSPNPAAPLSPEQRALASLSIQCRMLADRILRKLEKVKPANRKVMTVVKAAVRLVCSKEEFATLQKNLDMCRGQLHLHLSMLHNAAIQAALDNIEVASEDLLERLEKSREKANQQAIQDGLAFQSMVDRYQDIAMAATDTFGWIFDNSSKQLESNRHLLQPFRDWLEDGDGIFHISGKPGTGKSTLMKFLCQHKKTLESLERWSGTKELVLGHFFFWNRGSAMQKSLVGLIRALMYHVVIQRPDIILELFPDLWDPARFEPWGNTRPERIENEDVVRAFQQLIASEEISNGYKFCFFIDGLDEFDEETKTHTNLLSTLLDWVKPSRCLKLCVSSRELPVFQARLNIRQRLRLQELTKKDIENVVRQTLQEEQSFAGATTLEPQDAERLRQSVIEKADGVFLWVVLTLKTIVEALQCGESVSDLFQMMNSVPQRLEDFLGYILDSIPLAQRKKAAFTFAFALGVEFLPVPYFLETLLYPTFSPSLCRYSFLDDIADDPDFLEKQGSVIPSTEAVENRISTCRTRISGRCRGLLEFRPYGLSKDREGLEEIVRFTHRSIPEFLGKYLSSNWGTYLSDFDLVQAYTKTFAAALKLVKAPFPETHKTFSKQIHSLFDVIVTYQGQVTSTHFGYLDEFDAVLHSRQLESKPEFPEASWTKFRSAFRSRPCFESLFHTALGVNYHPYVRWKLNRDPHLVAGVGEAAALIAAFTGIYFEQRYPSQAYRKVKPDDVLSTTETLLEQGLDLTAASAFPNDRGILAWECLLVVVTSAQKEEGDYGVIPLVWAAVEACLQRIDLPPVWHRRDATTLTISIPKIGRVYDASQGCPINAGGLQLGNLKLPGSLQDVGGAATLEDFLCFHSPPNAEKVLQILEGRKGG
ncbi:hypothetical protein B0T18DRAFT_96185 [Schizothecium vesticola]|uniref:NACHT domain-containing protein n=1 Tax=Schizothecium vesticola TaxID=314040 RepID=A0AA40F0H2_9PEZI|nr:hypothetical protein B0T18DRAFT_96185 [Schizothecium vesticola]